MGSTSSPARHYCDHRGCDKSFLRAEHLTRHKLNHTNSTIQCPQCDRLFYRKDLLHRHLTLKHGQSARSSRDTEQRAQPVAYTAPPAPPAPSAPPAPQTPTYDMSRPAYPQDSFNAPRNGDPTQMARNSFAADPRMVPSSAGFVAPMSMPHDVFTFGAPSLDLTQDWSWMHQSPHSMPASSVSSTGPMNSREVVDNVTRTGDDWMSSASTNDLYVSLDIHNYLVTLRSVVDASRLFSHQEISNIMSTAFGYIMRPLPVFHRPSFSLDLSPRELSSAIFCVGLLISDAPDLVHIGFSLLGHTRSELINYTHKNTVYASDIGLLQAMLVVEHAGMFLADRAAMELTDIFHGMLVTLCRRLGYFVVTSDDDRTSLTTPAADSTKIHTPTEIESAKRIGYLVFAQDVELALLYGHSRSILSLYSMKLDLPSQEGDWQITGCDAQTGQTGQTVRARFHILCHSMLLKDQSQAPLPTNLSQFSNVMVLIGYNSMILDLRRRQDPFTDKMSALTRLRYAITDIYHALIESPESAMKMRGCAMYHMGIIALTTPLDDLERAANHGFSRAGKTPKQHTQAAIIRLLTRHKVVTEAARHAVELLKLYLLSSAQNSLIERRTSNNMTMPISYVPYETSLLYLATLVLWAFVMGASGEGDGLDSRGEDLYLPDRAMEATSLSSPGDAAMSQSRIMLEGMETAVAKGDNASCRSHWRRIVLQVAGILASKWNSNAQEYSQVLKSLSDSQFI